MYEALSIALLDRVTRHYLRGHRFTGIPVATLIDREQVDPERLREALRPLVQARLVSLEFGERFPDPYVRAFQDAPAWYQLNRLGDSNLELAVAFPSQKHLERVVDVRPFAGRPFTLRLALGTPRMKMDTFHPSVLAYYADKAELSEGALITPARSEEATGRRAPSYGLAHDFTQHQAIVVCVGELARLPPPEQQLWQSASLPGTFRPHPDYERGVFGHAFSPRLSVQRALREEMRTLNRCCAYLRRPSLFPSCHVDGLFLDEMGATARPSLRGAGRFLTRLQILSIQNLNPAFFASDDVETRIVCGPYARIVTPSTTSLHRLDNWLIRYFGSDDPVFSSYLNTLRAARRRIHLLQNSYAEGGWEESMGALQKHIVRSAYAGFREARKRFERRLGLDLYMHPAARNERIWSL
jgi:hypothetical protein